MKSKLWTKDFTIITLGSVVSMLGNTAAGVGMSLLVLDYTGSTLYYALFLFAYTAPSVIMPLLAGPYLDKFSRKKVIYTLDFCSAVIYLALAALLRFGAFNYPILLAGCLLVGSIESVYQVAYDSLYPMLIGEGNFTKAYAVSSTLETLTVVMWPVSIAIYKAVGIFPLFAFNTVSFLVAAIFETKIGVAENYTAGREAAVTLRSYLSSLKEGISYLKAEKGLLAVALYFTVSSIAGSASNVVTLPYFKNTYQNGEYIYMWVWGMSILGRTIGGSLYYKFKYPRDRKFTIALTVYLALNLLEGGYLFFSRPVMMACCFLIGLGGVTSYNIRISATQSYVPDERKGRFNGIFQMMTMLGALAGQLAAGAMSTFLPERTVVVFFMSLCAVAALLLIGGNKTSVRAIYNRDV
ncbi:MAG: MFS transporter [Oscillospiraceae bacterium]|nr:MFS transporter [Oscillospiraceae bacterium]